MLFVTFHGKRGTLHYTQWCSLKINLVNLSFPYKGRSHDYLLELQGPRNDIFCIHDWNAASSEGDSLCNEAQ